MAVWSRFLKKGKHVIIKFKNVTAHQEKRNWTIIFMHCLSPFFKCWNDIWLFPFGRKLARTSEILKNYFKWFSYGNAAKFYNANADHVVTMSFVKVKIFDYLIYIFFWKNNGILNVISMFTTETRQNTDIFQ